MRKPLRDSYFRGRAMLRRIRKAIPEPPRPIDAEMKRPWFQDHGFETIIDVGANEGQFASWARAAFPRARLLSFEPLPDCCSKLRARFAGDSQFVAFECALGASAGTAVIHRNEYSPASSLRAMATTHREAFPFTANTTELSVQVRTLDEVVASQTLDAPVLLKLDVQGFEAQVLDGATATLERVHVIMLELALVRLYEGEPLFDDLYGRLRARGFQLTGVVDTLRRPADGRPLQIDAVFERREK